MWIIKKYSASGLYSGEPIESFEDRKEAVDYLNDIANKREAKGYCVDFFYEIDMLDAIEITHDNEADAFTYRIAYEDNSPKYRCNICQDDDFDSEYLLDEHVNEYHSELDADEESA
jgi:hypothetical protein